MRARDILPGVEKTFDEVQRWFVANPIYNSLVSIALLFLAAGLVFFLCRFLISRVVRRFVERSPGGWDNALFEAGVFHRLSLVPAILVVWQGLKFIPHLPDSPESLLERLVVAVAVIVMVAMVSSLLDATERIYRASQGSARLSIKGYLQVANILSIGIGVILVLAILLNQSPVVFLGGLGAMTAVLVLVFKDTILGFVASLQIAGNDMVRVGDWIEMPSAGADGDVIDIALHTMKVQNFDKTITTVPTYMLIQESFKNWRGMSQSGGRRIKRSLWFDVNTIRFLKPDEIDDFGCYALLHDYISEKREELEKYNQEVGEDANIKADTRRLTNIGTLRAYIERYLENHASIHKGMTLLVRQLQSTSEGVPVEIYCFTNTTDWNRYEAIQADIFDHILAILPEFGLRIFQNESDHSQAPGLVSASKPDTGPVG